MTRPSLHGSTGPIHTDQVEGLSGWPSQYEGDVWKLEKGESCGENFSNEGNLISYGRRISTWTGNLTCRDNVFFSEDLNTRILVNVLLGVTVALIAQYYFRLENGEWDKREIDHISKEVYLLLSILQPVLALFLGFYIAFMVTTADFFTAEGFQGQAGWPNFRGVVPGSIATDLCNPIIINTTFSGCLEIHKICP